MKLHVFDGHIQSIYLAEYPDKLLLLDGCCRADIPTITQFVEQQLNRSMSDLKLVVVTHMHPDHAGAAHKLRKITGCKIASSEKTTQWYAGFQGWLIHRVDILLAYYVASAMKKPKRWLYYSRKLKPDYVLSDAQTLPGFDDWQALFTPGHTSGDVSLFHQETQQVYVADVILKIKGKLLAPFPIFHPNKYKASLTRIQQLRAKTYYSAHGAGFELTDEELQRFIDRSPKKPRTYLRVLQNKKRTLLKSKLARKR